MLHVSIVHSFPLLSSISLGECNTAYPFTCWKTFGLFLLVTITIKAVCTFVYKFLYEHKFSFFMGEYTRVEQLGHKVHTCLTL